MGINKRIISITRILLMAAILLMAVSGRAAGNRQKILIITSYNPDTKKMFANLTSFNEEFTKKDKGKTDISIETLNCNGLSEGKRWTGTMENILNKYKDNPPSLIILMGPEAWSTYLSQDSKFAKTTPCMPSMVGTNTVILPKDSDTNWQKWEPQSIEYTDKKDFNIVGGTFYKYDIEKNINIARQIYPGLKEIALLTDYSMGGVMMQALVKKVMLKHKDIKLKLLDGRVNDINGICNKLKRFRAPSTVLFIGTWRIDRNDNFVLANTTGMLFTANKKLPAFSLSSVGMGNWALGGYVPVYTDHGKDLADLVYSFLNSKAKDGKKKYVHVYPTRYCFDEDQINNLGVDKKLLPKGVMMINTPMDFFTQYHTILVWIFGVMIFIILAFLYSLYYIVKIRTLKDNLERYTKELKEAKEVAEAANNIKTSFIANMSHEIRTPLNAIVGFSELLVQDDYDKQDRIQFGHIIRENSNLLLQLINSILDISRIESGRVTMDNEPCEIVDLCHTSLVSVEHAKKLENVEFKERFPVDKLTIMTDPTRLKQVIINLLTNSSKFTKKGSIELSFNINEESNEIEFAVTDTGIGIPKEKAEKVFERFVKLNQFAQGTGLGLSLCRIFIEKLGGKIWVDTDYTGGARFVFTHPINKPENNEEGSIPTPPKVYNIIEL